MLHFLNWRIIALQYCAGFCHASTWIPHGIHMSSPSWTSLPSPTQSHPSKLSQSTQLSSLCHTANPHWLCYYMWCISFHAALSVCLSPSLTVCTGLFSMPVPLCLANRFISTISGRLYFSGLQNHYIWWLQPWN